jgi:ribose/xylose/arabinose/galactoside ABC-type transport system permease subunit
MNVARQSSMLLIMALGMMMAMLLGRGVDMSMGAIVSISSCFAATFFLRSREWPSILMGIIVGIVIGALSGAINGVFISFLKLPAMLVTFGVREILRGIAYAYMDGGVITSIHPAIRFIGSGRVLGFIPTQVLIALVITFIIAYILRCTRIGRELYICGANPSAAVFSGIKLRKNIILGFMFSGILAAIAGIIYVGRLGAAEAEIGNDFHFQAVSAAAIGGVSFSGGSGSPWGVVAGALILTLLNNAQNLLHISSAWQGTIYGGIIILAVLLDFFVRSQQAK